MARYLTIRTVGPVVFLNAAYAASTTPNSVELGQKGYAKVPKLCSYMMPKFIYNKTHMCANSVFF